jgi:hypothetical protein
VVFVLHVEPAQILTSTHSKSLLHHIRSLLTGLLEERERERERERAFLLGLCVCGLGAQRSVILNVFYIALQNMF